jgi:glycosyltransferase involved in cell wall biosynthesis
MGDSVLLTVFTPTYNRAHTLTRTYESLKKQDSMCFEWLIVDDGSSDGTDKLVEEWMKADNDFSIRYIYKENGGMHSAYNVAYANITTELNVCIDSDDCLAAGAARKIKECWEQVRNKNYSGLIGLDSDMNTGEIIGSKFPDDLVETNYSEYYGHGGTGDKKFVFRTDLMKQYPPYPEYEGENYVGIACRFAIIDQDYKMAVLNEVLCNVEYQIDGHSRSMYRSYLRNPKGFAYNRKIMMMYPVSRKRLLMETIHYISSSIIGKNKNFIKESPRKALTILLMPAGCMLTVYIKIRAGKI